MFLHRLTIALVLSATLMAAGAFGVRWYLTNVVRRVSVSGLELGKAGSENILLVGSTDRCSLKQQNIAFGLCSEGVNGINSDVIMVLHLDMAHHRASLLSIPRDTFVPNARTSGAYKIDAALQQGPSQVVQVIENAFGIPINHYVEVNFDGFQGVVDALGGVRMYFPEPVFDAMSGLNVATPGCHSLGGFQALAVVRARHLQYKPSTVTSTNPFDWPHDPQSDLSRIQRDHEFLRVLASKFADHGLGDPVGDESLLRSLAPQLTVDLSFSLTDMAQLGLAFQSLNPQHVPELTLPVSVSSAASFMYDGSNYGSVVLPVEPEDQAVIDQFLGIDPPSSTEAQPQHAASSVSVVVDNGNGERGSAATTASALSAQGFDATAGSDVPSTGPISETVVAYPSAAPLLPEAQAVARALSGVVVMALEPSSVSNSITVVTGSDVAVQAPPAAASPAPTTGPSSVPGSDPPPVTTTPTGVTGLTSSQLAPPTAATAPLTSFDPRSCTTNGGPGP